MGSLHPTRSRLVLALAAGLAAQCNCPGPGKLPPWDAGTDGVPDDTGHDTGPARDAGRDAGAARDAGPVTWLALPGLSERCGMMAVEPAAVHPPLSFEPCPDRPACRQLVADWESNDDGARFVSYTDTGYHDGERGIFVFAKPDPSTADRRAWWTVIATDAGEVLAVVRHRVPDDRVCFLAKVVVGEGRFVIEVVLPDLSSRILGGELSTPAATLREVARYDPAAYGDGWISYLRVGAEQMAFNTTGYRGYRVGWDGSVRRMDRADGTWVDTNHPSVVGSTIVFDDEQASNHILVSEAGGPPVDLVPPPAPGAQPSVHYRTDGRTLAWLTGFDSVGLSSLLFERVELWASPFAARAEDLAPVRIAQMRNPGVHAAIIGGWGHAAVEDDDAAMIRFFRVADAHETELRAPEGTTWTGFVSYIGPREVMVSAGTRLAYSGQSAVMFIDHTALEPPL